MALKTEERRLMFKGGGGARMNHAANYERPGHYWSLITRVKADRNFKKEAFLAIEKVCIRCWDAAETDQKPGEKAHRPGEQLTHMMMEKFPNFLGNVKAFIVNVVLGGNDQLPEDQIEQAMMDVSDDEKNPLAYYVIETKNRHIKTKEKGNLFCAVNYIREVPAEELIRTLTPEEKAKFFPDPGYLDRLAAAQMQTAQPAA